MKRVQFPPFSTHANFQDQVIHSQLSVILATSEYSKWIIFVAERQISVHISEFPIPCCPMGKRSWSLASVGCSGSGMRAAKEICKWIHRNLNYRLDLHCTSHRQQCILVTTKTVTDCHISNRFTFKLINSIPILTRSCYSVQRLAASAFTSKRGRQTLSCAKNEDQIVCASKQIETCAIQTEIWTTLLKWQHQFNLIFNLINRISATFNYYQDYSCLTLEYSYC